jgi:hypothetical protein
MESFIVSPTSSSFMVSRSTTVSTFWKLAGSLWMVVPSGGVAITLPSAIT